LAPVGTWERDAGKTIGGRLRTASTIAQHDGFARLYHISVYSSSILFWFCWSPQLGAPQSSFSVFYIAYRVDRRYRDVRKHGVRPLSANARPKIRARILRTCVASSVRVRHGGYEVCRMRETQAWKCRGAALASTCATASSA